MNVRVLWVCLAVSACSKAAAPPPAEAPEPSTITGELAGMRYLEHMTGGARHDERVPMILVLHPMGGDPEGMLELLQRYPKRARLILPYGYPRGGKYVWFATPLSNMSADVVTRETDRLSTLLRALVAVKPTSGKPLVTGFSQGGFLSFALAITNPDEISAALPIGGTLPSALYPSAAASSVPRPAKLPPVIAFHGTEDLVVPLQRARESVAELKSVGYPVELREYAGLAHSISPQEFADVVEQLGRLSDATSSALR